MKEPCFCRQPQGFGLLVFGKVKESLPLPAKTKFKFLKKNDVDFYSAVFFMKPGSFFTDHLN